MARYIRVFASNYLQENLLTLPSVPTPKQLQEIKEVNEREATERLQEIEHQRQEQRRLNLVCKAKATAAVEEKSGLEKFSAEMDKMLGIDKLRDFSKDFQDKITSKKEEEAARMDRKDARERGEGWMCAPEMAMKSVDREEDPFVVQREQLLAYIAQARQARRMDEVRALEQSLKDIELAMEEKLTSYGMEPHY